MSVASGEFDQVKPQSVGVNDPEKRIGNRIT